MYRLTLASISASQVIVMLTGAIGDSRANDISNTASIRTE